MIVSPPNSQNVPALPKLSNRVFVVRVKTVTKNQVTPIPSVYALSSAT